MHYWISNKVEKKIFPQKLSRQKTVNLKKKAENQTWFYSEEIYQIGWL